jgi:hypothetical protein
MCKTCLYTITVLAIAVAAARTSAADPPLVEKFLVAGKLSDGETALIARLKEAPQDDQARAGLGVLQFLQTFEHLGANLYQYGLRVESAVCPLPKPLKEVFPNNPKPKTLTYKAAREILQGLVDDLAKVEATLAAVKDSEVKLPLHVGLVKIDPFGQGTPISAAFLFGRVPALDEDQRGTAEKLIVGFDRGDLSWLRGYCHLLSAMAELLLAVDSKDAFDCSAHLFFENVDTPHTFLLEDRAPLTSVPLASLPLLSDLASFLHHMSRLPIAEPKRTKAALEHLEAAIIQAKEMWHFILAETDDDNEWIPNPKQTGVLGVKVTQEMIDVWLETLDEAALILKGKKLIPLWRGKNPERGVNLRRIFTEPRTFDAFDWLQGTAATPYLEKGPFTKLVEPGMVDRLNKAFGGPPGIIGFGFWFN